MANFKFQILNKEGNARNGVIETKRGKINTPAFMPIATQGAIKFTPIEFIEQIGYDLILSNTYHLLLRPGLERLSDIDGVSEFMTWNKPVLTDSGGFQVMSLAKLRKITEEGVNFQSHIDGSKHFLTPENVIDYQNVIKSDIQMVLDECIQFPESYEFEGYAIGGLAVGEGHEKMVEVVNYTAPLLPENKVRYLMGVGRPKDIIEAVYRGVDIFDCVIPTREGRHGLAYVGSSSINLKNSKFENDLTPLDERSDYFVSNKYSKSYLNHLLKIKDPLGSMLISLHNLNYYYKLMEDLRKSIKEGSLNSFREDFYSKS